MKVVILAGRYGTRLSEKTGVRPRPMVEIGEQPDPLAHHEDLREPKRMPRPEERSPFTFGLLPVYRHLSPQKFLRIRGRNPEGEEAAGTKSEPL